jgi:hypothetical protein
MLCVHLADGMLDLCATVALERACVKALELCIMVMRSSDRSVDQAEQDLR